VALPALVALLLVPWTCAASEPREAFNLRADQQEWVEETFWFGTGDVQVQYQDITVTCDEMELNLETRQLTARGSVVLEQGPRRFTADELTYDLATKTGLFINATGSAPPSYYFTSAVAEKLDETHFRLEDATFTTCGDEEVPPWQFNVKKALLEEEGYGRFRSASFRVKGTPVMYLPYIIWPVKTERAAGLLMPSYGYSDRRGAYLGNALFIPIGRSYDTTIYLDAYSKGHLGVGSEWRWAPKQETFGEITAYTIRNADDDVWQWKVNGRHRQEDFFGFRLLAEAEDLSDIDFFQEFERSFDQNTRRSLYSYLYLTRSWGPYALNLRADRRKTFLGTEASDEIALNQLPEVELRVRPTRIGQSSLYWSLISSANLFDVDRGDGLTGTYGRADLFPQLSYTLPGPPWLTVTPRIGGRATYYTSRYEVTSTGRPVAIEEEAVDRSYLAGGIDIVGPSISRVFTLSGNGAFEKLKHVIEPRLEYDYLSDEGDTSRIPRFDEVDNTRPTNRVKVTLANLLFGRSAEDLSARDLASFEVSQEYSFSDPLNQGLGEESQKGPLEAILRITPSRSVSFDGRASYDTLFRNMRSLSVSANYSQRGGYTNITWYEAYLPTTGERASSQIRSAFGLGSRSGPFSMDLHLSYDVEAQSFQQQRAQLRYRGSCWGLTVEYRDQQLGRFPSRDYRVIIDLKDVGRLFEIQGGLSSMNE
jgi:LPS-assembly protein